MSTTKNADASTDTAASSPSGWVVTMPGAHPYCWYEHAWKGCTDSTRALQLFEPHATKRSALIDAGWAARPGSATELYAQAQPARISA